MDFQNKSSVEGYLFSGKAILVFIAGGVVFHLIVMIIDYFPAYTAGKSEASSTAIANVYFVSFNNDRYLTLTV